MREAAELPRVDRRDPFTEPRGRHVARLRAGDAPVVAATDRVRAWPQRVAGYLGARCITLGTDDFGRSDTREQLRRFLEVDAASITASALQALRGSAKGC